MTRPKHVRRIIDRMFPGTSQVELGLVREARTAFADALAGQRRKMWVAFGLTAASTVTQLLTPWPLKVVLDEVLIPAGSGTVSERHAVVLVGAGLAAVALPLWTARFRYRATIATAEIGKTATLRIRRRLFDHINRMHLGFHTQNRTGDLLVRLTGDVNLLRDMLFNSWLNLVDRGLYLIGVSIALFIVDWRLALLAFAPLPLLMRTVRSSTSELRDVVKSQRKREGNIAAFASESLTQIRVVKAFAAERETAERFSRDAGRSEKAGVKAARLAAGLELSSQRVSAIGGGVVLFAGALLVMLGQLSTGVLLVAVAYTKSLYKPLRKITAEAARLAKAAAVTERVLDILRQEPEPVGVGVAIPDGLSGRITASRLGFSYPGGSPIFSDVSFDLEPGTLAVLTGPNGVGKSTMMALLLRFVDPSAGQLRVDGRSIQHFRLDDYRRRIAYVPQEALLFSGTIRENILLGNPDATTADMHRAVAAAHLESTLSRLPDGIDSIIGERGETLSGGEARRVSLARAAVREADILLLDEPFESIDADSRPLVAMTIKAIARGRTTLVISHVSCSELQPDVELVLGREGVRTRLGS